MARTETAFLCESPASIDRVYGQGRRETIGRISQLYPSCLSRSMLVEHAPRLRDVQAVFSTWGMPTLDRQDLALLPALKLVLYGAGSVKGFAEPLLDAGITVVSAWQANAVPVAEFTLAQILLANKGYFRNAPACSHSLAGWKGAFRDIRGNYGRTVAILGAGAIGRKLIELLRPFKLAVVVWDPFLSAESARGLGVEKVETLAEAFGRGAVVSNHLANVPETRGLLTGALFDRLPEDATFINTGRGTTVREDEMAAVLARRPDLSALLDVTDPEPPVSDSPLYALPNVHLTSHIAGSIGDEVVRMGDYMIEEFLAWEAGRPLRCAVTRAMLSTMA
ncbi:MAG: putative 2-hydroxyacid dehydrogenase YoaD [Lentisphaerae bacterium ADurb.BinA184]|nr:MAG: putative 2-hydroxyacid dehydrogenase YoaD [Lentisphaerae bacterium ADurb.BinA184]